MYSIAKRRTTDLFRYIHGMSPQKANKSFYFRIQTDKFGDLKKAICFDKEMFSSLRDKRLSGEPVKISDVVLQDKTDSRFPEVIVNISSKITEVDTIEMDFP